MVDRVYVKYSRLCCSVIKTGLSELDLDLILRHVPCILLYNSTTGINYLVEFYHVVYNIPEFVYKVTNRIDAEDKDWSLIGYNRC